VRLTNFGCAIGISVAAVVRVGVPEEPDSCRVIDGGLRHACQVAATVRGRVRRAVGCQARLVGIGSARTAITRVACAEPVLLPYAGARLRRAEPEWQNCAPHVFGSVLRDANCCGCSTNAGTTTPQKPPNRLRQMSSRVSVPLLDNNALKSGIMHTLRKRELFPHA